MLNELRTKLKYAGSQKLMWEKSEVVAFAELFVDGGGELSRRQMMASGMWVVKDRYGFIVRPPRSK